MSLTLDQRTNLDGFPKAAELIEITGTSALEASDRATINLLYQFAHESSRISDPTAIFELPITDLLFSSHTSTDRIRETLARILAIQVHVNIKHPRTGHPALLLTHLFTSFIIPEKAMPGSPATVQYRVPPDLLPILLQSNRWGRIKAEIVCAMSSKYAISLYELIQLRANMDRCIEIFPIVRFRELLGVPPGTYTDGTGFVRKVINPATLEVNGLSDMGVKIEVNRRSSRAPIETVTVAWWRQTDDEYRASLKERNQPKAGRSARLRGSAERMLPGQMELESYLASRSQT